MNARYDNYRCPYCMRECVQRRRNVEHAVPEKSTPYANSIRWYDAAQSAIQDAGGHFSGVIKQFPDGLLETLIRNNIYLDYRGPKP